MSDTNNQKQRIKMNPLQALGGINWLNFFVSLTIIILIFQVVTVTTHLDEITASFQTLFSSEQFQELEFTISDASLRQIIIAWAFFCSALICWFIFALLKMKEDKAFIHLLIPSILCLLIARLDAGILGLLASWLYYRKNKTSHINRKADK